MERGYKYKTKSLDERERDWYVSISGRLWSTCYGPVITKLGKFSVRVLILPYELKQAF